MGSIVIAQCKKCTYNSSQIFEGGGRLPGGKSYCLILDQTRKEVIQVEETLKFLGNPSSFINQRFPNKELFVNDSIQRYYWDFRVSRPNSIIDRVYDILNYKDFTLKERLFKFIYIIFNRKYQKELKHKCPKCGKFTMHFLNVGFWD